MSNVCKKTTFLSSLLFSTSLIISPTFAGENQLDTPPKELAQLISVSQLSDVQSTDWAFQSLISLVERYGCIAGYSNGSYLGNSAMSRYEFAAGLNFRCQRIFRLLREYF
ncbi:hypothetical protein BCD64_04390 [Nostoc sp. MBR 210]|nr:hypothetical protein BCD64_04390 [Nostoc sp. MBR 210]